ncbi:MAG: TetR/AcrR family transcriptional regulator [Nocardioidaceae bacterium]
MATEAPTAPVETPVRRPMRADAQRNYDRLIESARETFTELGGDTPLEEVARRAGVGIGTLYRHFPTRLDLLETIYREDVDRLSALARTLTSEREPWAALEGWLEEFSAYAATKRVLFQEIVAVAGKDAEVFIHSRAAIGEAGELVLNNAQRAGVVRADIEVSDVTRLVGGCTMMPGSDAAQQRRMLQLVLDGIRVPPRA